MPKRQRLTRSHDRWLLLKISIAVFALAIFLFSPLSLSLGSSGWVEPPRVESVSGELTTELVARKSTVMMGDQKKDSFVYDGNYPGKTMVVKGGDVMKINVENHITESTNLHFHGSHVSPKGNSDNVYVQVEPGETFEYEYHLPESHPPGLYWYHPHWHGFTDDQVSGGMAGAIIVKGDIDELPGIKGLAERLFVLTTNYESSTAAQPTRLVNGKLNPTVKIRPGEIQRWRLLNASADDFYNFALGDQSFYVISRDGNTLSKPVMQASEVMAPGDRIEVLVVGPTWGSYPIESLAFDQGFMQYTKGSFATLHSFGLPVFGMHLPDVLIPNEDFRTAKIDNTRRLVFTVSGTDNAPLYLLDGRTFDSNRVDQLITLGTTEEWELVNNSKEWHPFHIHINPFQVIEVNGQPVERYGYDDTFGIPANGSVKIRTRYKDFDGKFVLHCHILFHEDHGMMQAVRIVDPQDPDASLVNSEFDEAHPHMHSPKSNDFRGRRMETDEMDMMVEH